MCLKLNSLKVSKKAHFSAFFNAMAGIALGLLPVAVIGVRQVIIDEGVLPKGTPQTGKAMGALLVYIGIHVVRHLIEVRVLHRNNKWKVLLKDIYNEKYVAKITKLPYAFLENQTVLNLMKTVENVPDKVYGTYENIRLLSLEVTRTLGTLLVVAAIDYRMAVGVLPFVGVGVLMNRWQSKKSFDFWKRYIERMKRPNYISSIMIDKAYALERKLFGSERLMNEKFGETFDKARRDNERYGYERFRLQMLVEALSSLYAVAAFLVPLPLLVQGSLSLGMYTSLALGIVGLMEASKKLFEIVYDLQDTAKVMDNWRTFLNLQEVGEAPRRFEVADFESLEFRDVYFQYPERKGAVLKGVRFKIEKGVQYALVGENGSGKSTLIKLLLGVYTPSSGQILVNGTDVSELSQADRRALFSAVFQDYAKYPLSIRENMCLGSEKAIEDGALYNVAKSLKLNSKIEALKEGLNTNLMPLKNSGVDLSGGEWQKLAASRVLLSDAPMVILDEPNAALDPLSEVEMYKTYQKMLVSKTSLFITHRLGAIKFSDEILVLKDGRIAESGTHDALMASKGHYHQLYTMQRGFYDK